MRFVKVALALCICCSLAACGRQGSTIDALNTNISENIARAEEFVREAGYYHQSYNALVETILHEYEVDTTAGFTVQFVSSSQPNHNERGYETGIDRELSDRISFLYIIQDPSGETSVKVWHSEDIIQDWTWLYEHLFSQDISVFLDENNVKITNMGGIAFIHHNNEYLDFCSGYRDAYYEELSLYDPIYVEDLYSDDISLPNGKVFYILDGESFFSPLNSAWETICASHGDTLVDARIYLEVLNCSSPNNLNEFIVAINLLLENGITSI